MIFGFSRALRAALLVWLAGLALSALLVGWTHHSNQRLFVLTLASLSDEAAALVSQRLMLNEYGLRGARGAVVAAGGRTVSRAAFTDYMATREMEREFPGALGFGFIRRVARADEARFLVDARAEGPASFAIRELGSHDGERFVIQYIYPLAANPGATGLDVASEAHRREAALAAAREGRVRITAPITLVQANAKPRGGFLTFLPVYARGAPIHTEAAREAATIGWTYAPLVIDEVFAGFDKRIEQVGVQLTDSLEQQAFFDSAPAGTRALAAVPSATRDIEVFGRVWRLQVRALPAMVQAVRPTSLHWVAGGAVFGSTLLALLVWLLLVPHEGRARRGEWFEGTVAAPVTLGAFLRSPLLRWAGLAYLVFLALFLASGYRSEWNRQLAATRLALTALVDERALVLRNAQSARRKALNFLAEVPPVRGLARSLETGTDPADGSRREMWELRMQQILSSHLRASPEVHRARLVGLDDGGRELVRVERRGSEVVVVSADALRRLGDDVDVQRAAVLLPDEVWVSEPSLSREQGLLELPHRPTVRYATPAFQPDGRVFAVLMVHVDVSDRLFETAAQDQPDSTLFITGASGDFFGHPDAALRFGADRGQRHRWNDQFEPATGPEALRPQDRLQVWRGPQGLVLAASAQASPNPGSEVGAIRFTAVLPLARVERTVWSALGASLLVPAAGGVMALLLLLSFWAGEQRRLQARSERLRLAAMVDQLQDAVVGLDADQRVVAWNRGAVQLFEIDRSQAIGRQLLGLIRASDDAHSMFDRANRADSWQVGEFACCSQDGRQLRVAMTRSRLAEADGLSTTVVLRDVTEEHAARQQIADLNRGLEQQLRERTEMLDVLAHEIRQPLHNASAAMESASSAFGAPGSENHRAPVMRAQAVLLEVQRSLDNTLAVAALLARPDPIHVADADVDTLIRLAIADMPAEQRGNVRIERESTTRTVLMDTSLMRLALRNLLSNALKFNPRGSVVRVRIADSDTPLGLIIDVIDSGPGVAVELLPRLFMRGARGSNRQAGHGLGLYIVQQVMALHQGSAELVRTGPEGSTFRLTIVQGLAEA